MTSAGDSCIGVVTQNSLSVGTRVTVRIEPIAGENSCMSLMTGLVILCEPIGDGAYRIVLRPERETQAPETESSPPPPLDHEFQDHYEVLQISPHAEAETIRRVYRMLAQRYHPDNADSADEVAFRSVRAAYVVLSDPDKRAAYDAKHQVQERARWRIFSKPEQEGITVSEERRKQNGVLLALYRLRRSQPDKAAMSIRELEKLLDCPREHLEFTIWYLRGKGYVERGDNSSLSITPEGVDVANESGELTSRGTPRLIRAAD